MDNFIFLFMIFSMSAGYAHGVLGRDKYKGNHFVNVLKFTTWMTMAFFIVLPLYVYVRYFGVDVKTMTGVPYVLFILFTFLLIIPALIVCLKTRDQG